MPVTIILDEEQAERLSDGIADVLCWLSGYRSARPDDRDLAVLNIEAVRDMNIAIQDAIARQDGEVPVFRGRDPDWWDGEVARRLAQRVRDNYNS